MSGRGRRLRDAASGALASGTPPRARTAPPAEVTPAASAAATGDSLMGVMSARLGSEARVEALLRGAGVSMPAAPAAAMPAYAMPPVDAIHVASMPTMMPASEPSSHVCPMCSQLMAGAGRDPILLVPCGHTFCASCLARQTAIELACPYCRSPITGQAVNQSLKQLIASYRSHADSRAAVEAAEEEARKAVERAATLRAEAEAASKARQLALKYLADLRGYRMRYRIVENSLLASGTKVDTQAKRVAACDAALGHLKHEEASVLQRMEALKKELDLVRQHVKQQEDKKAAAIQERVRVEAEMAVMRSTLSALATDIDKCAVIVQGHDPTLPLD
eukprot:PLAT6708.1.p1 GENE.PLAT6708.1~~PLAT6708.1.p1  ORF type:complete len:386 (+),score=93.24 PLAT6708.1:158-1159(+)